MTPVSSHTLKAFVAELVRKKQPECEYSFLNHHISFFLGDTNHNVLLEYILVVFADPTSDAPAVIPDGSQSNTQNPFETNITGILFSLLNHYSSFFFGDDNHNVLRGYILIVFADPESDAPAVIPGGSQPDTPNPFQTNHTGISLSVF